MAEPAEPEDYRARTEEDLKRVTYEYKPYPNYPAFADRLARVLAQAEVDKEKLIVANLEWDKKRLYDMRFTMLNEVHAERIAAEGKGYTAQNEFSEEVKKMEMYSECMELRLEYIYNQTKDPRIKAALRKINSGHTQRDTIRDVLSLAVVAREHLDFEGGVRPNGTDINEAYLDMISRDAEALLHTAGDIKTVKSPRGILVQRQKGLITLCHEAIVDIKFYAKGAFNMDKQYYRDNYVFSYTKKGTDVDEVIEEEDPITDPEQTEENPTSDPQE